MENTLGLYKLTNAGAVEFPSADNWAKLGDYKYSATRMGTVPSITATLIWPTCLDELWDDDVFVEFRGEKYFLKDTPSSSRDNTKCTYSHNVEFVSERTILSEVYFFDAVKNSDSDIVSDNSEFSFSGDINVFAEKINASMNRSGIGANSNGYYVVVDEGMTSESELFQSSNQFIYDALKAAYELYEIPFYFVGKTIHFGNYQTKIETPIEYGSKSSALSISKNNKNKRIVNRITGLGSDRNITYYYPNPTPKGYVDIRYNTAGAQLAVADEYVFANAVPTGETVTFVQGKEYQPNQEQPHYNDGNVGEYTQYNPDNGTWFGPGRHTNYFKVLIKHQKDGPININVSYSARPNVDINGGRLTDSVIISATGDKSYYPTIVDKWNILWNDSLPAGLYTLEFGMALSLPVNISIHATISIRDNSYEYWKISNDTREYLNDDLGISVIGALKHGDTFHLDIVKRVNVSNNLMPPKYRDTDGSERFYDAMNNLYKDEVGEYYEFSNQYTPVRPREYIYTDEEIYPSITGIVNASGQRIDMVAEVAFDKWDDNEIYPEDYKDQKLAKTYKHPYFFVKLRKTDGENGFNLFDSAIDGETMKISFTSGHVASCEFEIGVDEDSGKNTVQVDSDGNLVKDKDGNVVYRGKPQDVQQNTMTNEVWIALKKEESTMGVLMPDTKQFIQPTVDDTFVILGIDLPDAYILAAEKRLERAILDYMRDNNSREFTYSVKLSSIYLAENKLLYESLNENSMVGLVYDSNNEGDFFVDSYSYSVNQKAALPEISITLNNEIKLVVPKSKAVNDAIQNITTTSIKAVAETGNLKLRTQALEAKVSKIEDVNIAEDINNIKTDLANIDERVSDLERSGGGGSGGGGTSSATTIISSNEKYISVTESPEGTFTITPKVLSIDDYGTGPDESLRFGLAKTEDVANEIELIKDWLDEEFESYLPVPSSAPSEGEILVYDAENGTIKDGNHRISTTVQDLDHADQSTIPTCAQVSEFVSDAIANSYIGDLEDRVVNGKKSINTTSIYIKDSIIEDESVVYALPTAPREAMDEADHIIATNNYVDSIVGDINTLLETIIVG